MTISEHFSLEELSFSETAARLGLDNTPGPAVIANLSRLAAALEQVRGRLRNCPMVVHSGYRSAAVNHAVGGVLSSAHCLGLACDFVCPSFGTPGEVARAIASSEINYDQLILEYGWVHVSVAEDGLVCRRDVLTKRAAGASFETGIRA